MNALTVTFSADPALSLPVSYNAMLQGFLYSCWRGERYDLHEVGYRFEQKVYRLFTFSWLTGRYTLEGKTIRFEGPVSFEVRSPREDLIEILKEALLERGEVQLGQRRLPLLNLQSADRFFFPEKAIIRMRTPMTIHVTQRDGSSVCIQPDHGLFRNMVEENLRRKSSSAGLSLDPALWLEPKRPPIKRVTQFKDTNVTCWQGKYLLAAKPDTMRFLYYAGLGDRNSQGFGMFDIEERRPRAGRGKSVPAEGEPS